MKDIGEELAKEYLRGWQSGVTGSIPPKLDEASQLYAGWLLGRGQRRLQFKKVAEKFGVKFLTISGKEIAEGKQ